jgi:phosphoribosylanthranilate isomerase
MGRVRIKVCGITSAEDALLAAEAGADALGFVFVPGSPRYVAPEEAWAVVSGLPPLVSSIGVFVNPSLETFSDIEELCPTVYSQLQGAENERLVRDCGPGVIKGVRGDPASIRAEGLRWDDVDEVDAILVDAGAAPDWTALGEALAGLRKPVFLGGALTVENVREAIERVRPYAVDVAAGVEREPGKKDPDLVGVFCERVRQAGG